VLHANPTQMHQMIMNLSTNAAQAMSEQGGILEIALSCVVLTDEDCAGCPDLQPGPYLKLQVRDTGTGIAPQHITRIFDPFFTTKEVGKGTGMGLAVVHGIVKNLGGDIRVHSELEKGTCFEVLLPSAEQAAQLSAPDIPAVRKGTERILLIDDEIKLLTVGKKQLEALGYVVTEKQSSLEALDLFQKNPYQFDLIITDQTMPRMTGDLLARKAMDIRPGMPVILCTGFSEKITKETAKKSGIRAFIMKPFRRSEIAATIREVLDSTET
jgi:CheY-like chemotaxis protein/anti-sigma regulatory factor (Ser/Thr protein kinase)